MSLTSSCAEDEQNKINLKQLTTNQQTTSTSNSISASIPTPASTSDDNKRHHPLLNRLIVLKNLQMAFLEMKAQYFNELHGLETSYEDRLLRLCKKRQRIIDGSYVSMTAYKKLKASNLLDGRGRPKFPCQKLPYFWLAVLLQSPVVKKMIKSVDVPVLEYLNDIRVRYNTDKSFTIEFYFDRNDYFSNAVLRKKYYQILAIDKYDPFTYEGPEIYRSEGCEIYWKQDKNITIAFNPNANSKRNDKNPLKEFSSTTDFHINSQSQKACYVVESFFNFFNPPQVPMEKVVVDMELERILTIDFEIGNFLRKKIIPSAIPIYVKFLKSNENLTQINVN